MKTTKLSTHITALLTVVGLLFPALAYAHCDTVDGPVVTAAKAALDHNDVTPVLKWVTADSEAEIRQAFARTQTVRKLGPEARDLADQYFFETVVRLHRASEGEPFTGLKPAGTEVEPAIAEADKALETGSADGVVKLVSSEAAVGIRQRFASVREKQLHAGESVTAGREYVAAYVDYIHYVEELHQRAGTQTENKDSASEHATQQTHPHSQEAEK